MRKWKLAEEAKSSSSDDDSSEKSYSDFNNSSGGEDLPLISSSKFKVEDMKKMQVKWTDLERGFD